jgi:RimJ/RimL family protein N-acetyltransferase
MTPSETPTLRTQRLVLRPLTEPDLPTLADRINDIEIARWLATVPFPYSLADAKAFLAHVQSGAERVWVIEDGAFRGILGLGDEFGYWLERTAWGQGYASEASRAVLSWHFAQPDSGDVLAGHFIGNQASARVLEKLGFECMGTRLRLCRALGHKVESRAMRLSRAQWQGLNPSSTR